ncbi:MAG: M14 family metallopeptidase [Daejeonella sp.]|uniref:M14 family metallopeptidase n=1 Tax=Daejeonella sp. TaxID=2805397 RepID=UPI002732B9C2|nr:M14 family metallopeptidase [Daejeonella sp.]MDP3468063.1 M14 family metallopeptidase [Daejeonella sp.]
MNIIYKTSVVLWGIFLFFGELSAQDYSNNSRVSERINSLAKTYPSLVKVKSLTKTLGGKDIWMLSIGKGNTEQKPAIAIVGGVEGSHLLGTELALGFAEKILKDSAQDSIMAILGKNTFYVFPNMSPDATEQYFAQIRYARSGNAKPTDDDRDGKLNEDGFDDLNKDGKISWIRIEDPTGKYRINPEEPRSMILADPTKGETGKYLLFSEGTDNDKDGSFNEDAEGGVHFNKNMSYDYPNFIPGSGEHMVSEIENRTLLDNLFEMFNIYSVITFGPYNNLSVPVAFNAQAVSKRIITGYFEADAKANTLVSELYNKTVGLKDAPKSASEGGDFAQWAYFHYGRHSFSTPGWWVPKAKADTIKKVKELKIDDPVANYLRWADSQGLKDNFTEWKKIEHPDFPGQTVELGGIDPFVLNNPPFKMVEDLVKKHSDFILALSKYTPYIDITNIKKEKLGNDLTRVTVSLINKGILPTQTKVGERSYWVKKLSVKIITESNQTLISGRKNQTIDAIQGQGYQSLSWLIKGSGKMTINAGSPTSGTKNVEIPL